MMTLKQIRQTLEQHKGEIIRNFKVKGMGVFGSYVRNHQGKRSDIDILVEFSETPGFFGFIDLENYLSGILGVKVDLVMKSALKPVIGKNILQEVIYI